MLRLTLLSAAIYGVNGAAHGNSSGNATAGNATAAPATAPPTTAPPATLAPTTGVPATMAAATEAATMAATDAATMAAKVTTAPTTHAPTTHAPTTVSPRAGCGNDTTSANCTTTAAPVVTEKVVTTSIGVDITLDISAFTDDEKLGTGNGIAFGIHDSACDAVLAGAMAETKGKCLIGESKVTGISFNMAMSISSDLLPGSASQPGCTSADCYGEPVPARRLAPVKLTNKGDFAIKIAGAALEQANNVAAPIDYSTLATAAITVAKSSGALAPAMIQASLKKSFNRTSVRAKLGDKVAVLEVAAATATVTVEEPVVSTVTMAPTAPAAGTSGAYTAGAASALALIAGVFLF